MITFFGGFLSVVGVKFETLGLFWGNSEIILEWVCAEVMFCGEMLIGLSSVQCLVSNDGGSEM